MTELLAISLSKSFRGRQVVKDVSLSVKEGEIVGLLGPNGAGKTTSFYMIVGLIPSEKGVVKINDIDVTLVPMHGRAKQGMGYLTQEPSIFRKLSTFDNIMAVLETRKDLSQRECRDEVERLLASFNISHLANNTAMSLSGGERRRLEIARALAMKPSFILLDEPFAGVDPISVIDIQRIVRQLADEGIGILITDHNVRETLGICDRAYIISEGTVITEGAPDEILNHQQVRKIYLGEHFKM